MILQMFLGVIIEDAPEFVIEGERDRKVLHENYEQRKEYDIKYTSEKSRQMKLEHRANVMVESNKVSHYLTADHVGDSKLSHSGLL